MTFNISDRVRLLRPNLWAGDIGSIEAKATIGKDTQYRVRVDRGFLAPARPEEIELLPKTETHK